MTRRLSKQDRLELADLRARQQSALPLVPVVASASDEPLTTEELVALSRLGWERDGERTTTSGLLLVMMRDYHSEDRHYTEERSPGGWRQVLAVVTGSSRG